MQTSYTAANNLDIRADGRLVLAVTEGTEAVSLDTATTQAREWFARITGEKQAGK